MQLEDLRWVQRFRSFQKALAEFGDAVNLSHSRALSKLESQGLIQAFEFSHELAWKVLKDFLEHRSGSALFGSKDSTRAAFKAGLVEDGETWLAMVEDRNLSVHTYSEKIAAQVAFHATEQYYAEFRKLEQRLNIEIQNESEP